MVFTKPPEYLESIYNISTIIHRNATEKNDKRFLAISSIITNYANKIMKEHNLTCIDLKKHEFINLVPFFEYVSINNIQFYDFNNITVEDFDVNSEGDLERYVLSHIYYITQK